MDRPDEIGEENRLLGDSCARRTEVNGRDMQRDTRDDISHVNCANRKVFLLLPWLNCLISSVAALLWKSVFKFVTM